MLRADVREPRQLSALGQALDALSIKGLLVAKGRAIYLPSSSTC